MKVNHMSTMTVEQLGDALAGLSLKDAVELGKYMKDKYGIEAAAGGGVMVAAAAGAAAPKAEEKTSFDVVLKAVDAAKKIGVIKVVREIVSGLGLKEAKDLVDGAPKPLLEKVTKEAAEDAKAKLEAAGASVTVK